jgi:hypothetical protein
MNDVGGQCAESFILILPVIHRRGEPMLLGKMERFPGKMNPVTAAAPRGHGVLLEALRQLDLVLFVAAGDQEQAVLGDYFQLPGWRKGKVA